MSEITSPYNFVPLSSFILRPDWAPEVSHDQPFSDGVCGELELCIEATSPLCVGGEQQDSTEQSPGKILFNRTPNGEFAIPGTSLKGMLRNVLSIASFGHFRQVEERRLGVRDISSAKNFYSLAMNREQIYTGWLTFQDGRWDLAACNYVRVHHELIIDHCRLNKEAWLNRENKTAKARYGLVGGLRPVTFNTQPYKFDCKVEAKSLGQGEEHGYLVITGQAGADYTKPKGKKREFIFTEPTGACSPVNQQAMADFMFIHTNSEEWHYWREQIGPAQPGIPVFFHKDTQGQVKSMGLARMYRLAYDNTLHDAINNTHTGHQQDRAPDLAELIFGLLSDEIENDSLRGRVNIGLALADKACEPTYTVPMVLSGPSATFYPSYIKQTKNEEYITLMNKDAELAGWKRYPVRDYINTSVPADNNKIQVQLETLPKGTRFVGKLRMHNLRLCELGALLWALDFGQRNTHRHSIGTGKPYGYGQIAITVSQHKLRCNTPNDNEAETLLLAARYSFDELMQAAWQSAVANTDVSWQQSPQVIQLLAMADPAEASGQHLDYPSEPKEFSRYKTSKERLEPYAVAAEIKEPDRQHPLTRSSVPTKSIDAFIIQAQQEKVRIEAAALAATARDQRAAAKAKMSTEDRILENIVDLLKQAESSLSATDEKKLAQLFNSAHANASTPEKMDIPKLLVLAKTGQELASALGKDTTKLGKAIKKILRDFSA
jgi:CRISPR-associated protein (TIGR03986 family)